MFAKILFCFLLCAPVYGQQILSRLSNPKVSVVLNHPPGLGLQVDRIAFRSRGDQCSDDFTAGLTEDFLHGGMDVIDRSQINAVLDEIDFSSSGYIDSATAVKAGRLLGPSALVFVNVTRCTAERNRSHTTTETDEGSYKTYYSKTEAFFKASIRVVDLSTARIFTAKTIEKSNLLQNYSEDGYPDYPAKFEAIDGAMAQARDDIYRMFFSWTENRSLVFFNNKRCDLKEAHRRIKAGDLKDALAISERNIDTCENDPKAKPSLKSRAYYNVGVIHFIMGQYDEAIDYLDTAYQVKAGSIAREALQEAQRAKSLAEQLQQVEERAAIAQEETVARKPAIASNPAKPMSSIDGDLDEIERKLVRLKSLFEKGLITQKEYEKKKAEVLASM